MCKPYKLQGTLRKVVMAALGFLAFSQLQSAMAQTSRGDAINQLEEVTVTATKRAVSIQEVPVSILAISGDVLNQNAINDLAELSRNVPNLVIGDAIITTAVSIRGMGSQPERSFEQSVGMFIDGIYMPRSRQYRAPFMDVLRVEVMRGPQAVLFGLNSTAGAVSIITNRTRPGDEAVAEVTGEYEFAEGGYRATAILGGSPTETLGLRLAARTQKRDDFILNDYTSEDEGGSKEIIIRFSAVWQPNEKMSFDFKYEGGDFDLDGNLGEQWGPAELNQLLLLGLDGGDDGQLNWEHRMDASVMPILTPVFGGRNDSGLSQEYDNLSLTGEFYIGEHTLTAILGTSEMEWDMYSDLDASKLAIMDFGVNEEFEQDSVEIRWTSPGGGRFDYILGYYMHDSEVGNNQPTAFEPTYTLTPGAYGFDQVFTNGSYIAGSDLWSLFATGTMHINDHWAATAGIRYTDEEKDYRRESQCLPVRNGVIDFNPGEADQSLFESSASDFFCANLDGYTDDRSSDNWMPEVALEWDLNDDVMFYGKYSRSAKSGGWVASTIVAPDLIAYDDEKSDSWEFGMRSYLAEGRVALNMALYRTQFDDLQVNSFDPISLAAGVRNAATATSQGIEIDGSWLIVDWLTMNFAYAYLDATYDSFVDSPCPVSETLAGTPAPCDASGKRLPLAPRQSFSMGFDARRQVPSGLVLLAGLNVGYTDDYHTDAALEPALIQSSFTTVGARIGLEAT
ncbi:MAG: TonB-dependent receptor, partial [Gammaproteobacteria bacterium]|nr:TonB-dependent receptor [Gammaproteobacteria bacterium]